MKKIKVAALQLRKLKSGNATINIYYNQDRNFIKSTGVTVPCSIIGKDKYIINPNNEFSWEETEDLNNNIRTELSKINKAIHSLSDNHTIDDLENFLDPNKKVSGIVKKDKNLLDYIDIMIDHSERGIRKKANNKDLITAGTIKNYKSSKNVIEKFSKDENKELTIPYLYGEFWNDFRNYMLQKDNLDSNIDSYFKDVNTAMNYVQAKARILDLPIEYRNRALPRMRDLQDNIIFLLPDELRILDMMNFNGDEDLINVKDLFLFQKDNMLRISELYSVRKENIRRIGNIVEAKIWSEKKQKFIIHDMSEDCINILEKYNYNLPLHISEHQYNIKLKVMVRKLAEFMITAEGKRIIKKNNLFTRDLTTYKETIKKNVNGEIVDAEVLVEEKFSSHCARKSGITEMIMGGIDDHTIREKSGHSKDSKEFNRYFTIIRKWMNKKIVEAQNNRQKLYINKDEKAA